MSAGRGRARGKGKGKDSTREDEAKVHAENFGKWAKMACSAIKSNEFILCACVSNRVSEQLDRILWSMEKRSNDNEPSNFARLIFGGASRIKEDLQKLVDAQEWVAMSMSGMLPKPEQPAIFLDGCVKISMRVNCDFERRIIGVIESMPWRMFWFGHTPHNETCSVRQQVAKEVLDPTCKEINTVKIRKKFQADLQACIRDSGRLSLTLYAIWRFIVLHFIGDNSEIEGVMSLIKLNVKSAPHITQALIDARVGNKKYMGLGARNTQKIKWSKVEARFEAVLQEAVDNVDGANNILGNEHRFTPPMPALRWMGTPIPRKLSTLPALTQF